MVVVRPNLEGAKYTLAVPAYMQAQGLKDFNDIHRFAAQLNNSIYGIEPGNDGNRLVLKMIKDTQFDLGDFKLVESSEQGELAQVERAVRNKEPIVFLAWEPHPMNMRFDLKYLTGGDAVFGANFGGATVYTVTRKGYAAECPNMGRLLANLTFTLRGESEMMAGILDRHEQPEVAAAQWIKSHDAMVKTWLEGVRTFDGRPAYGALAHASAVRAGGLEQWIVSHKIPRRRCHDGGHRYHQGSRHPAVRRNFHRHQGNGRWRDGGVARPALALLLILAVGALAWFLRRSWSLTAFVVLALVFILNQGYWEATLETLALVLVATIVSALIGVPLGIAAAHRPRVFSAMRPVLDLMHTLPTFVYLIPTLVLFADWASFLDSFPR